MALRGDVREESSKIARLLIGRRFASPFGMNPEATRLNDLSEQIIGAAIDVHRVLGPGLLEAPYEECLCHELVKRGFKIERQKPLPLVYGDVKLACAYRMDIVVEGSVIIEAKPRRHHAKGERFSGMTTRLCVLCVLCGFFF